MTIFQILQRFHASLCPLGHGGYIKNLRKSGGFQSLYWVKLGSMAKDGPWSLFNIKGESGAMID